MRHAQHEIYDARSMDHLEYVVLLISILCGTNVKGQVNGAMRLARNGVNAISFSSGRIQLFVNGMWGNICGDEISSRIRQAEADVMCHHLGYTGASDYSLAVNDNYGIDALPTVIDDVHCSTNTYLTVLQCTSSTNIDSTCDDNDDIGVNCYTSRIWDDAFPGMVRLTIESSVNEGYVQVYCNGQWGTVCSLSVADGNTVCQQLGYQRAQNITAESGAGTRWANSFSCSNPTSCVGNCWSCPSSPVDCGSEITFITCESSIGNAGDGSQIDTCNTDFNPSSSSSGAIRLSRNGITSLEFSSGRVQAYYNNGWGNICRRSLFSLDTAHVICHQLGFVGAESWSYAEIDDFGIDPRIAVYDEVDCADPNLLTFYQCAYSVDVYSGCTDLDDISVTCSPSKFSDHPYDGMVRLTGSPVVNEGLVEVYCNGQWGTVCSDGFSESDAIVLCRQLGYGDYSEYDTISGNASLPIWFRNLVCSFFNSYNCITQCNGCPSSSSGSCSHSQDIYLSCVPSSTPPTTVISTCQVTDLGTPSSGGSMILFRNGTVSSSFSSGRVVLYYGTQWGNICRYSTFGSTEADVVCHQLGYSGASSWSYGEIDNFGRDTRPAVISDVSCTRSSHLVIHQCNTNNLVNLACVDDESDVSVTCYTSRIWDTPYSGMVRLVNGDYSNEGRVEVYCNGQWGTVCDNTFGASDGGAVCAQLGYSTGTSNVLLLTTAAMASQPIWLNSLTCVSGDLCISTCQQCQPGLVTTCSHNQDATLRCGFSTTFPRYTASESDCKTPELLTGDNLINGKIALLRNDNYSLSHTSGRVVVYSNLVWGNICRYPSFTLSEADVMCHQLSYSGAASWSYASVDSFGIDTRTAAFSNVSCGNSEYINLWQCSLNYSINPLCTDDDDISITCYTTRIWDNPFNGMIRLMEGDFVNEGRLDVYCNGQWGTVCDDSFDVSAAVAACRQLGYSNYSTYGATSNVAALNIPIWLDNLNCASGSSCIMDCQRCPGSENSNCGHNEDISIVCYTNDTLSLSSETINSCSYSNNVGRTVGIALGTIIGVVSILSIIIFCCLRSQYKRGNIHIPPQLQGLRQRIHLPVILRSSTVTNNAVELHNYECNTTDEPQQPPPDFVRPSPPPSVAPPPVARQPPPPYNPNIHIPPTDLHVASEKPDSSEKEYSLEIGFRTEEPPPYMEPPPY